eukprot:scaffold536603_cov18-Prasinocladus_malaysianus.AAC.1
MPFLVTTCKLNYLKSVVQRDEQGESCNVFVIGVRYVAAADVDHACVPREDLGYAKTWTDSLHFRHIQEQSIDRPCLQLMASQIVLCLKRDFS